MYNLSRGFITIRMLAWKVPALYMVYSDILHSHLAISVFWSILMFRWEIPASCSYWVQCLGYQDAPHYIILSTWIMWQDHFYSTQHFSVHARHPVTTAGTHAKMCLQVNVSINVTPFLSNCLCFLFFCSVFSSSLNVFKCIYTTLK